MDYQNIIVESKGAIGIVRFNKEKSLNAICSNLIKELATQLDIFENDDSIACIVITGNDKAFAAGIDIKELAEHSSVDGYLSNFMDGDWVKVSKCRKPVIAAVAGFALGAGCELALMCDFIIAADNAKFGQPEVTIGVTPGMGGTQRLTKAVGKSKAMEMILTGRSVEADEAERIGIAARVVPLSDLLDDVVMTANRIAKMSRPSVMMAKEAVNASFENSLEQGLKIEKKLYLHSLGTEDKEEGLRAFSEKRKPEFTNS